MKWFNKPITWEAYAILCCYIAGRLVRRMARALVEFYGCDVMEQKESEN